jgi:CheY-like chemotaxis protein
MSQESSTDTRPATTGAAAGAPLVLVVEDHERNARMLEAMLSSAGYRSQWACDGEQGLRLVADLNPTVVITDLQMPGMDGLAMTRQLKANPATAPIPVIALSAHAMTEHGEQALAAGCVKFLTKPIRFQSLLTEVADVVRSTS